MAENSSPNMTQSELPPVDIAELRKRLGTAEKPISQAELGRRCNTAASTIHRYEEDPSKQMGPLLVLLHKLWAEMESSAAA